MAVNVCNGSTIPCLTFSDVVAFVIYTIAFDVYVIILAASTIGCETSIVSSEGTAIYAAIVI